MTDDVAGQRNSTTFAVGAIAQLYPPVAFCMPFTPAHPALVVPLLLRWHRQLSATGLVLGAMAPDFEYFLRLRPDGIYGHTLPGLFWLDLPLVLGFAWLYHAVVKWPLVQCLPGALRARLLPLVSSRWPVRRLFSAPVLLGGLLGCASHLLWDAFTHDDGLVVQHWPGLRQVLPGFPPSWPLYELLQYVSTVVGVGCLAWVVARLPALPAPPATARWQKRFWLVVGGVLLALWGPFMVYSATIWPFQFDSVLVTGMSAGVLGVLAAAALLRSNFAVRQEK